MDDGPNLAAAVPLPAQEGAPSAPTVAERIAEARLSPEELAKAVIATLEKGQADFHVLYDDALPLLAKIEATARRIYRADRVEASQKILAQLKRWEVAGFGRLPVCIAKTQYSFSTDPNLKGAPTNHVLPVREVRLSAGAEFIVVICGDIMTMPGLPKVPSAEVIGLDEKGQIAGLF